VGGCRLGGCWLGGCWLGGAEAGAGREQHLLFAKPCLLFYVHFSCQLQIQLQPRQGLFMIHSVAPFGRGHFVNSNAVAWPPDLARPRICPPPCSIHPPPPRVAAAILFTRRCLCDPDHPGSRAGAPRLGLGRGLGLGFGPAPRCGCFMFLMPCAKSPFVCTLVLYVPSEIYAPLSGFVDSWIRGSVYHFIPLPGILALPFPVPALLPAKQEMQSAPSIKLVQNLASSPRCPPDPQDERALQLSCAWPSP